jgi:hypothetical protein
VLAHSFVAPPGFAGEGGVLAAALPEAARMAAGTGFRNLFLTAGLISSAAFVLALLLPELPLRRAAPEPGTALE